MKHAELISKMTLEEKAKLCSGEDFWHLKSVKRLGLDPIMVCDGPHGLRKQNAENARRRMYPGRSIRSFRSRRKYEAFPSVRQKF